MVNRPNLRLLDEELMSRIVAEAKRVLDEIGIEFTNPEAIELLEAYGARQDKDGKRLLFSSDVVDKATKAAPSSFKMYDRAGKERMDFAGNKTHFVPGSAAINILDTETGKMRKPNTQDLAKYYRVSQALGNIDALATGLIPEDVDVAISDSYRLYLALTYGEKPVVTGAFTAKGIKPMLDMMVAVRGSKEALAEKPLAWFSCCPNSPLKFPNSTSQNLIDCARMMVPIETIAMPLSGFLAPVTLVGTLIQHTAETLSAVILAQAANEGAPVLYGGSPAIFDVRYETTPMGAIETMMIDCAYSQIGKFFDMPTQAYMALSDAKMLDAQAGLETGIAAVLASLTGVNSVSGPGMLDFESCQCIEKLVVDNEICGMAQRLARGIEPREDFPSLDRYRELLEEQHLLISEHTMQYLPTEHYKPSDVIDRMVRQRWVDEGRTTIAQRARKEIEKICAKPMEVYEKQTELDEIMLAAAKEAGMDKLPSRPQ